MKLRGIECTDEEGSQQTAGNGPQVIQSQLVPLTGSRALSFENSPGLSVLDLSWIIQEERPRIEPLRSRATGLCFKGAPKPKCGEEANA